MARFERDMFELLDRAAPASILDVGCGEGVLTEQWARAHARAASSASTSRTRSCARSGSGARGPTSSSAPASATRFPTRDGEFEAATAMEVLEHVPDPAAVLAEMARVASRWLLVSVPREPLWRALNMARGAYLRELGNTPGPPEPLVQAQLRAAARRATARSSSCARRCRGRWRSSASEA